MGHLKLLNLNNACIMGLGRMGPGRDNLLGGYWVTIHTFEVSLLPQ